MIPRPRAIHLVASVALLAGGWLSACRQEPPEPTREPPGPHAEGPKVDRDLLEHDPAVAAFREQAARWIAIGTELMPLEAGLAAGTLSEADTERWRTLDAERSAERGRLNRLMYAEGVTAAQRAAMWWILQGGPPSPPDPESSGQ